MNNSEHKRNSYIDVIKGISIISVVFGHCIQYGSGSDFFELADYYSDWLFKLIYSFHMPLFAVISGYLFFFSIQKRSSKEILIKQFRTLVIPIIAWTLTITFADTVVRLFFGNFRISFSWFKDTIRLCLTNLWFLWGIFYCSLAVIFIHKLFRDSITAYLLLLPVLLLIPNRLNSDFYVFLYPYFIGGYLFNKHSLAVTVNNSRKSIRYFTIIIIAVIYFVMLANYRYEHFVYTTGVSLIGGDALQRLSTDIYRWAIGFLGSILVMVSVKLCMGFCEKLNKIIASLGTKTMGIYIISNYLNIYVLLPLTGKLHLNYFFTLAETVVIIILSCLFISVIGKQRALKQIYFGGR